MAIARSQKEIRQRAPWLMVGLLVLNGFLMALSARDETGSQSVLRSWGQTMLSPFQRVSTGAASSGSGLFERIGNLRNAAAENEALKQKVNELETQLQQERAKNLTAQDAAGIVQLQQQSSYTVIPARVIARDPSGWFDTVILNQGSAAGVHVSMPVVTADGIVGRVVATSLLTSQVMLITDTRAAAGAVVGQLDASHAIGSVRGSSDSGMLEMRYVPTTEPVQFGDVVFTTGQDDIYPSGLKLGTVTQVKGDVGRTIVLKPSARFETLQNVAILDYKPPPRPPMTDSLPNVDRKK
jgi:rod shape-determining protein MreC